MHKARLYDHFDSGAVRCQLCAHRCTIQPGKRGICQVRENREGTLYSLVYGLLISEAVDPIEKKPLFHFYPGSTALSIATAGCNLRCSFCQNAEISQLPRDGGRILGHETAPAAVVEAACRHHCRSIAYTYTEPTIFYEYAYDVSVPAHEAGLANVFVTNGFMSPEMLADYAPYLDAANVDLKAFHDGFYRELCGARLQPVLDSLKQMKAQGVWLEVTTLLIPGRNDDPAELRDLAEYILHELGSDTPWHVSRFHPTYRLLDAPPTPAATLRRAWDIGREAGLHYVYVGNLPDLGGEDTLCPRCGQTVIERYGFRVTGRHLQDGACSHCGTLSSPFPPLGFAGLAPSGTAGYRRFGDTRGARPELAQSAGLGHHCGGSRGWTLEVFTTSRVCTGIIRGTHSWLASGPSSRLRSTAPSCCWPARSPLRGPTWTRARAVT